VTSPRTAKVSVETIALIREMAAANRLWGAERIRGELLKLGITVAKTTVQRYMRQARPRRRSGQTWSTFLRTHAAGIWACDFLPVTDLLFRQLYTFFIVELATRRVVHVAVTRHATDAWVAQQLREATPFGAHPCAGRVAHAATVWCGQVGAIRPAGALRRLAANVATAGRDPEVDAFARGYDDPGSGSARGALSDGATRGDEHRARQADEPGGQHSHALSSPCLLAPGGEATMMRTPSHLHVRRRYPRRLSAWGHETGPCLVVLPTAPPRR